MKNQHTPFFIFSLVVIASNTLLTSFHAFNGKVSLFIFHAFITTMVLFIYWFKNKDYFARRKEIQGMKARKAIEIQHMVDLKFKEELQNKNAIKEQERKQQMIEKFANF